MPTLFSRPLLEKPRPLFAPAGVHQSGAQQFEFTDQILARRGAVQLELVFRHRERDRDLPAGEQLSQVVGRVRFEPAGVDHLMRHEAERRLRRREIELAASERGGDQDLLLLEVGLLDEHAHAVLERHDMHVQVLDVLARCHATRVFRIRGVREGNELGGLASLER